MPHSYKFQSQMSHGYNKVINVVFQRLRDTCDVAVQKEPAPKKGAGLTARRGRGKMSRGYGV
ncbi:hypothetical protein TH6_12710 [Thalassospira profundimaris]|uniref:Uncharacterized protein n=1 Tax=Thalassospira profundimaris TaxID=502049 RepID=A0A367V8C3_9PROT|nr:hypothetical protein TH6_12710 [Thalassospira profundimaris]